MSIKSLTLKREWPVSPAAPRLASRTRVYVNLLSLVAALAGLVGWWAGSSGVRAAGIFAFAIVGLGAGPISQVEEISTLGFFSASVGLSLVVFVLIGFAMVETRVWVPEAAFVILAVGSCGLHAWSVRRYRWAPSHP